MEYLQTESHFDRVVNLAAAVRLVIFPNIKEKNYLVDLGSNHLYSLNWELIVAVRLPFSHLFRRCYI